MAIRKPTVALRAPSAIWAFVMFVRDLVNRFEDNPKFPNPPVAPATVRQHLLAFEDANAKVAARTMTAAERDVHEQVLRNDVQALCDYAQMLVRMQPTLADAAATAASAGLSLCKKGAPRRGELELKSAGVGAVTATVKAASGPVTYYWQTSLDGETWRDAPDSLTARVTITGLESHKLHYFRTRRLTREGLSDWSQVVTHLVA